MTVDGNVRIAVKILNPHNTRVLRSRRAPLYLSVANVVVHNTYGVDNLVTF